MLRAGAISSSSLEAIRIGAASTGRVSGLTHCFYRYPARFSPSFVGGVIEACSQPGDVILDPFMGGGTAMVEAMARGRVAIGNDLNALAVFVSSVKTQLLDPTELSAVRNWAGEVILTLSYHDDLPNTSLLCRARTRNLSLPRARPIKKLVAQALASLDALPSPTSKRFARCVLLNVAQWALHNRRASPRLDLFRARVVDACSTMADGLTELAAATSVHANTPTPVLHHGCATDLSRSETFSKRLRADLVVTSPPYPGIHVLYHRWQIDGRKETPAPYWIAGCLDGRGGHYYNFGGRHEQAHETYFERAYQSFAAIRECMRDNALLIQMIAFSNPNTQLRRYLRTMVKAGFVEIRTTERSNGSVSFRRIRRTVPSRAWHAALKGNTSSSQEVVLIHRAA